MWEAETITTFTNPIVALFEKFLPSSGSRGEDRNKSSEALHSKVRRRTSIGKLRSDLEAKLRKTEWLVTGDVDTSFFSENFIFKDPDVTITSIEQYASGVNRLFDQSCSRAEIISSEILENDVIRVTWRLSGKAQIGPLGLDIKPYIVYSDFTVDATSGLIVAQEDTFSIPGTEILLWALFPPFRSLFSPPAPDLT